MHGDNLTCLTFGLFGSKPTSKCGMVKRAYWLFSKSVHIRFGINRSDPFGVLLPGVVTESGRIRAGDFFGVFEGVFRTNSPVRFLPLEDGAEVEASRDAEKCPTKNVRK